MRTHSKTARRLLDYNKPFVVQARLAEYVYMYWHRVLQAAFGSCSESPALIKEKDLRRCQPFLIMHSRSL